MQLLTAAKDWRLTAKTEPSAIFCALSSPQWSLKICWNQWMINWPNRNPEGMAKNANNINYIWIPTSHEQISSLLQSGPGQATFLNTKPAEAIAVSSKTMTSFCTTFVCKEPKTLYTVQQLVFAFWPPTSYDLNLGVIFLWYLALVASACCAVRCMGIQRGFTAKMFEQTVDGIYGMRRWSTSSNTCKLHAHMKHRWCSRQLPSLCKAVPTFPYSWVDLIKVQLTGFSWLIANGLKAIHIDLCSPLGSTTHPQWILSLQVLPRHCYHQICPQGLQHVPPEEGQDEQLFRHTLFEVLGCQLQKGITKRC